MRLDSGVHDDAVHARREISKLKMKLLWRVVEFCFARGCALG